MKFSLASNTTYAVVLLLLNSPNWFRSYVSERKHYVLIDDQKSIETSLYFGVPQGGSVQLGSVLFILYTTPLTGLVKKHYYSSWMSWKWPRPGPFTSRLCYRYWVIVGRKQTHGWIAITLMRFVCHHLPSTQPCRTHRHSPSAVPILSWLKSSATSVSSSVAIFLCQSVKHKIVLVPSRSRLQWGLNV